MSYLHLLFLPDLPLLSASMSAARCRGNEGIKKIPDLLFTTTAPRPDRSKVNISKDLLWHCDQRLNVLIPLVGSGTLSNLWYWLTISNCWFMGEVFSAIYFHLLEAYCISQFTFSVRVVVYIFGGYLTLWPIVDMILQYFTCLSYLF